MKLSVSRRVAGSGAVGCDGYIWDFSRLELLLAYHTTVGVVWATSHKIWHL